MCSPPQASFHHFLPPSLSLLNLARSFLACDSHSIAARRISNMAVRSDLPRPSISLPLPTRFTGRALTALCPSSVPPPRLQSHLPLHPTEPPSLPSPHSASPDTEGLTQHPNPVHSCLFLLHPVLLTGHLEHKTAEQSPDLADGRVRRDGGRSRPLGPRGVWKSPRNELQLHPGLLSGSG